MTRLTPELLARLGSYTRELFAPEDAVLAELSARARREPWGPMQVTADVGRLLQVLATAVGARRALEVGTLYGYSAIWLARALPPGGRLLTVEADPDRAAQARRWIARAGLAATVEVRAGRALDVLPSLPRAEPFDLAFLDAAKEEYPVYLDQALELVGPGGVIAADNALFSGSAEGTVADGEARTPALLGVREYNRRVAADPRLVSTVLPVREGVAVSVVRRGTGAAAGAPLSGSSAPAPPAAPSGGP